MEIDHIFICIDEPDKMSQIFTDFGLTEGETNTHLGQGTANRRFFFKGFYVELLYIHNYENLMSPLTAATKLFEHFNSHENNASPFGIIFRPCDNSFDYNSHPYTDYKPQILPPTLSMTLFDAPITDPLYLYFDFLTKSSRATYTHTTHKVGFKSMTSVKITQPDIMSKLNQDLLEHQIISLEKGKKHKMEIVFDEGKLGLSHDFSPEMPLIFKW